VRMSDSEASDEATMVGSPRSPPSPEQVFLPSGFSPPPSLRLTTFLGAHACPVESWARSPDQTRRNEPALWVVIKQR